MGPNPRAPTIFPQSYGVVPQPLTQQLITQNPAVAGIPPGHPFFVPQQTQFPTTQQPIALGVGLTHTPQMGATSTGAPQHTMPHMMAATVNTPGTANQGVPPGGHASVTTGYNRPRAQSQQKRQSKAIKIINPDTKQEVSVGAGTKPENQPTSILPEPTSAQTHAPVHVQNVPPPSMMSMGVPPAANAGASGAPDIVQDFKQKVIFELKRAGPPNAQGTAPLLPRPPPPNAIITDPNKTRMQIGGVSSTTPQTGGGVEAPGSRQTVAATEEPKQQQQMPPAGLLPVSTAAPPNSIPPLLPTSVQPPEAAVSKQKQEIRDKFYQQVHQTVEVPPPAPTREGVATQVDKKGSEQEEREEEVVSSEKVDEAKDESSAAPPQASVQASVEPTTSLPVQQPVVQPVQQEMAEPVSKPEPQPPVEQSTPHPVSQSVSQPESEAPAALPAPVGVAPEETTEVGETTTEVEERVSEPVSVEDSKNEEEEREEEEDASKSEVASEVSQITEQQASTIETPAVAQPESTGVDESTKEEVIPSAPATVEPTPPEQADVVSEKEEESPQTSLVEVADGEKENSESPKPEKVVKERALSGEEEGTEEPPEAGELPKDLVESETKEEQEKLTGESEPESELKETQEVIVEPVSGADDGQVRDVPSVSESLPVEQLPANGWETERTEQQNVESESAVDESKTVVVEQQEPSLSSEISTATEKDEVTSEPPKPVKQDEEQQPVATTQVVNPVQPVQPVQPADRDRTSPSVPVTAKPKETKEAVKPAEPAKSEKKSKAPSAKPPGVPASAVLASTRPVAAPPTGELLLELYALHFRLISTHSWLLPSIPFQTYAHTGTPLHTLTHTDAHHITRA